MKNEQKLQATRDLIPFDARIETPRIDPNGLVLSEEEIIHLTHYRRAAEQLRKLAELGIPANRLRDNTVRVLRMHLIHPGAMASIQASTRAPQRKSTRK